MARSEDVRRVADYRGFARQRRIALVGGGAIVVAMFASPAWAANGPAGFAATHDSGTVAGHATTPSASPSPSPSSSPSPSPSSSPSAAPSGGSGTAGTTRAGITAAANGARSGASTSRGNGVGERLTPHAGTGKAIDVEAQPGTQAPYPAAPIGVTVEAIDETTPANGSSCTTTLNGPGEAGCLLSLTIDDTYVYEQTTTVPGFLAAPASAPTEFVGVAPLPILYDPGVYRTVGVDLTDATFGTALPGAGYALCQLPAVAIVTPPNNACPDGQTVVDSGVTNASGILTFPSEYLPGTYSLVETTAPAGHLASTAAIPITVPAVTTEAAAEVPFVTDLTNVGDGSAVTAKTIEDDSTPVQIPVTLPTGYTLTAISPPSAGTAVLGTGTAASSVDYTPPTGFVGPATFDYEATNADGLVDVGTATVTVADVPPTATTFTVHASGYTPIDIPVLSHVTTVPGNTVSITSVAPTPDGTTAIVGDPEVRYTSNGFVGTTTLQVLVTDNHGATVTVPVQVVVSAAPGVTPNPPITVPPATVVTPAPATLPFTGLDAIGLVEDGGLLVAGGALMSRLGRRRRQA